MQDCHVIHLQENWYYTKAKPNGRGYSEDLRIASFAGFAPVEDPQLVIYVVVDEPSIKPYYGGVCGCSNIQRNRGRNL